MAASPAPAPPPATFNENLGSTGSCGPEGALRKSKALRKSCGVVATGASRWQGTTLSKSHWQISSTQSRTSSGLRLKMSSLRIGATWMRPPACRASKLFSQPFVHSKGYRSAQPNPFMGASLASAKACGQVRTSRAPGWKKKPKSAMRCQPLRRTAAVSSTASAALSREWKRSARGSSSRICGGSRGTDTMASQTKSVFVGLW
mmetsp:Transcript_24444/g.76650  ORF Transcript_24444/g.76650 Transcript_24444/m.76650 type:complete len:203 (+) Transcript_24444:428-1036(+)